MSKQVDERETGELSGDSALEYYEEQFGKEFGSVYYKLFNVWAYVFVKTKEFRLLFSNRGNVDLINVVGGRFFGSIQDVLFNDILLQLTRITDKVELGRNKNLSIRMLPGFLNDCEMKKKVSELVEEAVEATEFARNWRNKRIAHMDHDFHMDSESNPLEPASLERVQNALDAIHTVLNTVTSHVSGEPLANDVIYETKAEQLITNISRMSGYMSYAYSLGEVKPDHYTRLLIDKFKSVKNNH